MLGKLQFGVYELDRDAMELRKHGVPNRLQEQPLRVLAALLERLGAIVTREELQQRIWGKDTYVDFEQSLNKAVNRLREALNDEASQPRYVETVPRRGYRFVAPVSGPIPLEQPLAVQSLIPDAPPVTKLALRQLPFGFPDVSERKGFITPTSPYQSRREFQGSGLFTVVQPCSAPRSN